MVLTAKLLTPPGVHSDPFSLAYGGVCGQRVTQWLRLAWHAAAVVGTLYEGTVEHGHFPAVPELTLLVPEDLTLLFVLHH